MLIPARSSIALAASRNSALSSTIRQRTLQPAATHDPSFADVARLHIPTNRNLWAPSRSRLAHAMDAHPLCVEVN
jgi:hypothetical protein